MLLIAGITLLRIKKHKYMIYAFRVTAKQNIGGSKGIAKGMSVQIRKEGGSPGVNDVLAAFKQQLGIEIKGITVTMGYFTVQKL